MIKLLLLRLSKRWIITTPLLLLTLIVVRSVGAFVVVPSSRTVVVVSPSSLTIQFMNSNPSREEEIRKKIMALKREGRLKVDDPNDNVDNNNKNDIISRSSSTASTDYSNAVASKLGGNAKLAAATRRMGREIQGVDPNLVDSSSSSSSSTPKPTYKDPTDTDADEADEEDEEDDLVKLVAKRLAEKKRREEERQQSQAQGEETKSNNPPTTTTITDQTSDTTPDDVLKKTTSGVGGAWVKPSSGDDKAGSEPPADYTPSRGSWGAFPRPRNISQAYGGGRRIGAGVKSDETNDMRASVSNTSKLLRDYKEKTGVEVQSEKDNANEIDEALEISSRAMQRGMYSTAVSSLEKVTRYCSTNSQVGSKVFLELGMAYDAVGRSDEAMVVFQSLTKSRNDEAKFNARCLLSNMEAMTFMRDEVGNDKFSTDVVAAEFSKATGFDNFAENFDDRYQTAYVDLNKGFYKQLTENVVRTNREARQILLRAQWSGEVERLRVMQALKSLSRRFDEALREEKEELAESTREPAAFIDGVPLRVKKKSDRGLGGLVRDVDKFTLLSADDMIANLDGEWRLQLMADKKGDTVNYYNTTLSWQTVDAATLTWRALCPATFFKCDQVGTLRFDRANRALSRSVTSSTGVPAFLSSTVLGTDTSSRTGAPAALLSPQQILTIDEAICVSREFVDVGKSKSSSSNDNVKDYYCVWRRVDEGTYCKEGS